MKISRALGYRFEQQHWVEPALGPHGERQSRYATRQRAFGRIRMQRVELQGGAMVGLAQTEFGDWVKCFLVFGAGQRLLDVKWLQATAPEGEPFAEVLTQRIYEKANMNDSTRLVSAANASDVAIPYASTLPAGSKLETGPERDARRQHRFAAVSRPRETCSTFHRPSWRGD